MPPKGRHETREIGRNSKIERAVSPSNGQLGTAEAVDQTFLYLNNLATATAVAYDCSWINVETD